MLVVVDVDCFGEYETFVDKDSSSSFADAGA